MNYNTETSVVSKENLQAPNMGNLCKQFCPKSYQVVIIVNCILKKWGRDHLWFDI